MSAVVIGTILCTAMTVTMAAALIVTLDAGTGPECASWGHVSVRMRACRPAICTNRIAAEVMTACHAPPTEAPRLLAPGMTATPTPQTSQPRAPPPPVNASVPLALP